MWLSFYVVILKQLPVSKTRDKQTNQQSDGESVR